MKGKLSLVIVLALLVASAHAGSKQAAIAFSFVCNGVTSGACPNGAAPNSLIQASDGNFYGTTANSGDKSSGQVLFGGSVFSLTASGKFTLLHTFSAGTNGKFANGATPISLTEGPDGKLYGLTSEGGDHFFDQLVGDGVVFRISKNGSGFQVIHRFCAETSSCADGVSVIGPLVVGGDGNVYGVTMAGGSGSGCGSGGCGTIFRVTPSSGAFDVVFSFGSKDAGGFPYIITPASDGSFYGLTVNGNGLFHFTPSAESLESMTLAFPILKQCPGLACTAINVLAFGPNGNLYGFYTVYDVPGSAGLFEVEPDGSNLQLFPEFTSTTGSGLELLLASDGNFWFPRSNGSSKLGDLVTISPTDGKVTQMLTPFNSKAFAPAEVIQATDGTLWGVGLGGVTTGTGHFANGAVFKLSLGLPPR